MKTIGVIPARYASTRLKAKVLADIQGKPMIQHVWERAQKSLLLDDLLIACDDPLIVEVARRFGAKAVLTSPDHPSGSDRIAEAVKDLAIDAVVNIQADEPLITPGIIDGLVEALKGDPACRMATVIKVLTGESELKDPNVVKVVIDQDHNALYFSRAPVPHNRNPMGIQGGSYKHLGLYAYRKDFLMTFVRLPRGELERIEQRRCAPDPVGERRALDRNAVARIDRRLAIKRQMIAKFGGEHMGEERRARFALGDRRRRRRRLNDRRAGAAGKLRANMAHALEAPRDIFELFAHVLAQGTQGAAAGGAA